MADDETVRTQGEFFANSDSEQRNLGNSVRAARHSGHSTNFPAFLDEVTSNLHKSTDPKLRDLMDAVDKLL